MATFLVRQADDDPRSPPGRSPSGWMLDIEESRPTGHENQWNPH
jgi:hypothetical protein